MKNCVIVPVEYMEQIEQKIEPARTLNIYSRATIRSNIFLGII